MDNYELYHYGVVGMKWGVRRAQKRGTTYNYESWRTKQAKKIAVRQSRKSQSFAEKAKVAKAEGKLDKARRYEEDSKIYANKASDQKKWAKASAKHDSEMQKRAESMSMGKAITQTLLTGGLNKTYHSIMVSGQGRITRGRAVAETLFYGQDLNIYGYLSKNGK